MVNDLQCSSMSFGSEIMARSHCSLMKCCKNRFEAGMPLPRFFWSILNIGCDGSDEAFSERYTRTFQIRGWMFMIKFS